MNYADKRILLIDDQRPFLTLLRGVINNLGAQAVVTVQNAEAALVACKKEQFDFIICDLHLGYGKKNGFQFLEEVRVRLLVKPETVITIVSADSERPMVLGSVEKNPDDYLIKPFSQAQLNLRLSKAYHKKMALRSVYAAMQQDDCDAAINACRHLIQSGTRYHKSCFELLTELYWRKGDYLQAKQMLTPILKDKPQPWVAIAVAKTDLLLGNFTTAIERANEVLEHNPLMSEGYDILAQCYLQLNQANDALLAIIQAIALAPMSVERQIMACAIARRNGDYEMAKLRSLDVWEQSKKSIHRDIAHLCSYFRSIVDAVQNSKSRNTRNKYQHEMAMAMARYRHDDTLTRIEEDFDYTIFENIINARLSFIDGRLLEARRTLTETQQQIVNKYTEYPLAMAPDSIKVMLDLGEYDDADKLINELLTRGKIHDEITHLELSTCNENAAQRKDIYKKCNLKGRDFYNQGKFQEAYLAFIEAQKVAPVNTEVALNILQCHLKIIGQMKKPEISTLNSLKQMYRHLKNMVMLDVHQQKFDALKSELGKYVEV
ncbi:MAG: DNA-binding NarL/FixJ family response regulator [Paraglaciecola sp.]|jgi:DNA-binding NarL/FixJ family response regulator